MFVNNRYKFDMKKILSLLVPCLFMVFCISSCDLSSLEMSSEIDATLLPGKWQSGTLFYKYSSNGTGKTWDTSDDVSESEAQSFNWTLDEDELIHIYIMETGGVGIPKVYTVTMLTSTTLKYVDDFGESYSFVKVID